MIYSRGDIRNWREWENLAPSRRLGTAFSASIINKLAARDSRVIGKCDQSETAATCGTSVDGISLSLFTQERSSDLCNMVESSVSILQILYLQMGITSKKKTNTINTPRQKIHQIQGSKSKFVCGRIILKNTAGCTSFQEINILIF
jgi:hypothetical protein